MAVMEVMLEINLIVWEGFEHAPSMDADETFNYVEPLHYNIHHTG